MNLKNVKEITKIYVSNLKDISSNISSLHLNFEFSLLQCLEGMIVDYFCENTSITNIQPYASFFPFKVFFRDYVFCLLYRHINIICVVRKPTRIFVPILFYVTPTQYRRRFSFSGGIRHQVPFIE
jgi:hypothetical protein